MIDAEVRGDVTDALLAKPNGLTARQLMMVCEGSCPDLQSLVVVLRKMRDDRLISHDGMRDSQTVYKLGAESIVEQRDTQPSQPAPVRSLVVTPKRTGRTVSGLREGLFDMLDKLKNGDVDVHAAKAYAALSMTIIKSVEVQMEYELMRRAEELPAELGDLDLVPALENKSEDA